MYEPLSVDRPAEARERRYAEVRANVAALLDGESDWVSAMATVVCELHHAFDYFHWTGFYRVVGPRQLAIGPYQGAHGCLRIPFDRGVCGACARERRTQLVSDVEQFPGHIACSSATRSEIVVPVITPSGALLAVLDVDSDRPAAFTEADRVGLEVVCADLAARFADQSSPEGLDLEPSGERTAFDVNVTPPPTPRFGRAVEEAYEPRPPHPVPASDYSVDEDDASGA